MNAQPQILISRWPGYRDFPVRINYTPVLDNRARDYTPAVRFSFTLTGNDIVKLLVAAESKGPDKPATARIDTSGDVVLTYRREQHTLTLRIVRAPVAEITLSARATERLIDGLRNAWIAGRDDLDEEARP